MKYTLKIVSSIKMNANYGKTDPDNKPIAENIRTVTVSKMCKDINSVTNLNFSALKAEIAKVLPTSEYVTEVEVSVDRMSNLEETTVVDQSEVTAKFVTVAPDLAKVTAVEDKDQVAMIISFYDQNFNITPKKLTKEEINRLKNSIKNNSKVKEVVVPVTDPITPPVADPEATV